MPICKFKVLAGSHFEGSQHYKKGDVLTSSRDLVKLFRGKFQNLGELQPPRAADSIALPPAAEPPAPPQNETPKVSDGGADDGGNQPPAPAPKKSTAKAKAAKVKKTEEKDDFD